MNNNDVNSIVITVIYNGLHNLAQNIKSGITQNVGLSGLSDGPNIIRDLITADEKQHFPSAIQAPIQLCKPEVTDSSLKLHAVDLI